ncbi:hypothetical protein [Clostridium sp. CF012]|uniref:hypothetical protein n=1 Tax=Clostridium sp. CF012 TaxID=2843319 RepID=UPI001C0DBD3B|nr:hypothetical protein [Clostridium sp. CF012]MBU3146734.1 hypothetical protein [Clostridium sp. CF012]
MKWFVNLLNNNTGVVAFIVFFIIIPAAIMTDKIIHTNKQKRQKKEVRSVLLKEFWININFVAQIEESYCNNIIDGDNLHLPYYAPRSIPQTNAN